MKFDDMALAPGGEGFWGHNQDFRSDRLNALRRLAARPEPMFRLKTPFPGAHTIVINDPSVIGEALVDKVAHIEKAFMLRFSLYPLAGEGLFSANGELWRKQRKVMAPLFTPRALEAYASAMTDCARQVTAGWRDGGQLALHHETTNIAMSVAGKTLFDAETISEADELGHALNVALDWTGHIPGGPLIISHAYARMLTWLAASAVAPQSERASQWLFRAAKRFESPLWIPGDEGTKLRQAIAVLDRRVAKMIADRRAAPGKQDLLSRILDARDDDGQAMPDKQVRDEILTLFVAGHETTAAGLAWAIYLLMQNPTWYQRVQDEVDALTGPPTLADLPRLGLCLRVFREALRIYPPVYLMGRDTTMPLTLGGYELPARTNVLVSPFALHHKPSLWPNPEQFDPDRFLPEQEAARHRYAYLPFGAGPRICIGNHFAYIEAQLVLAELLRTWRFESAARDEPLAAATLRPKNGIAVRLTRRSP